MNRALAQEPQASCFCESGVEAVEASEGMFVEGGLSIQHAGVQE